MWCGTVVQSLINTAQMNMIELYQNTIFKINGVRVNAVAYYSSVLAPETALHVGVGYAPVLMMEEELLYKFC